MTGMSASPRLMGTRFYELVPEDDGWTTLDVILGLHQRQAAGQLVLSIYADGVVDRPLRRIASDLTEAVDNGLFRFVFPPIADSRHRRMLLRFDLEQAGPRYADQPLRARPAVRLPHQPRPEPAHPQRWSPFCYLGFHSESWADLNVERRAARPSRASSSSEPGQGDRANADAM